VARANRLRGLLFDKDGTLVDFDRTWGPAVYAVMTILAAGDRGRLEALMAITHYVEDERRFLPTSPLIAGASVAFGHLWAQALDRQADARFLAELDGLFREEGLRFLQPIGCPAVIAACLASAGYALGIATNDTEESARAQARALELPMDFIAGYDSGFGAKPEPGMITAFADHLGVPASRIAMIGDSPYDLLAARAAGAVTIAVLSGPVGAAALAQMAPLADHVVDSIADLPGLLAQIDASGNDAR
jgi:phosphoglycolate phosphatase